MKYPGCGSKESSIKDTRDHHLGRYRRRECRSCGLIFSTMEAVIPSKKAQETNKTIERYLKIIIQLLEANK